MQLGSNNKNSSNDCNCNSNCMIFLFGLFRVIMKPKAGNVHWPNSWRKLTFKTVEWETIYTILCTIFIFAWFFFASVIFFLLGFFLVVHTLIFRTVVDQVRKPNSRCFITTFCARLLAVKFVAVAYRHLHKVNAFNLHLPRCWESQLWATSN